MLNNMKEENRIKYLEARVDALECIIDNIINYHQIISDRYTSCVPSQSNFWCEQIENLRSDIEYQLNSSLVECDENKAD